MALIVKNQFVDDKTGEPVELQTCPCTNNVFYFTMTNDKICACCYLNQSEAQAAKDARDAAEAAQAAVIDKTI